jgi:hypothetical protein
MQLRTLVLSVAFLAPASALLAANTNSFDLLNKQGAKVGTANYTLDTNKNIIKVHSLLSYLANGRDGDRTIEYRVGLDGLFVAGNVNGGTDHSLTYYTPGKAHDTLEIRAVSGQSRVTHTGKPDIFIAFPDEPGIWEVLLRLAAANPHPDSVYTLYLPAAPPQTNDNVQPFRLMPATPSNGTLDGKPITLQHFILVFNSGRAHVYLDADGHLMQAESPFTLKQTRKNFELLN